MEVALTIINIMDDNNTTLAVCAVTEDCVPSVGVSTIEQLRRSSMWSFRMKDSSNYKKTQSNGELNAQISTIMQSILHLRDQLKSLLSSLESPFFRLMTLESSMPDTVREMNFKNGAIVSPNKRSQAIHPTRRLGEANQQKSRRIKNATNSIKQHSRRIS